VCSTNNDPRVVASYYVSCVKNLQTVPTLVRSDRGSENIIICGIQSFQGENLTILILVIRALFMENQLAISEVNHGSLSYEKAE